MAPQKTRKSLTQSLVLSKLNFNNTVTYPLPAFLQKRVQRVQNAATGFVLSCFCSEKDVLSLGWLPILENTQFNILKLAHKAIYSDSWPSYLHLDIRNPKCTLRSSITPQLTIPLSKETASLFNSLEHTVRNERDHVPFTRKVKSMLLK